MNKKIRMNEHPDFKQYVVFNNLTSKEFQRHS
jgi:hypothetical protein